MNKHEQPGAGHDGRPVGAPDESRRSFLKAAPLGALAVVAGGARAREAAPTSSAPEPEAKRGYHETDHIRKYYRTASYW